MTTRMHADTLADELNKGNLNTLGDVLKQLALGRCLQKVKAVITGMTATAAPDITSATVLDGATITITPTQPDTKDGTPLLTKLPPILMGTFVRVTASGTAASVGTYLLADSAATPLLPPGGASTAVGIAALSADGTTITFPNTITAMILEYVPRPLTAMTSDYAPIS